jgi:hypothetical protein
VFSVPEPLPRQSATVSYLQPSWYLFHASQQFRNFHCSVRVYSVGCGFAGGLTKVTNSPNQERRYEIVRIRIAASSMFLALLGILVMTPKAASAQQVPGPHPAYLHALSDLRLARAYLDQIAWPPVQRDEEHAIREIDAAINEIKRASIDDGKNLEDHPAIDARLRPDGRFRKALELLDKAHNDTARAEDVPQARGMRDRAVHHIDEAHGTVDNAIRTVRWEEWRGM